MNKLNAQEIIEILKKSYNLEEIGYGDIDLNDSELGEIEIVDQYGGEGKGEDYWHVYYFKAHGVYLKIDGYYQSYNGAEFDTDPYEVKPIEKIITVFESI